MVMSRDQNAGRSQNMRTDNRSFEGVQEFKYLGKTSTLPILRNIFLLSVFPFPKFCKLYSVRLLQVKGRRRVKGHVSTSNETHRLQILSYSILYQVP